MGYYERDGRECYEAVGNVVKYASFEEDMEKCGHYARMLCGREGK